MFSERRTGTAVRLVLRVACAIVLGVGCLGVPSRAVGDVAPDPISGGVNLSGTTNKIEMSEEAGTLNVTDTRCTTNAVFQMKNLTDEPVTMDVGFPYGYPDDLQEFRVKVAGKPVQDVAEKGLGKRVKWKIWTMTFPAGEVTTIEVDYWNELQSKYSWTSAGVSVPRFLLSFTPWKSKPQGQGTAEERQQYDELAERLQHRNVKYILKTGAGWAGKIGKCRVVAKFDGFTSENLITRFPLANDEYLPRDPQVEEDRLVWELENFEPKDDIYFQVSPYVTREGVQELIEATLQKQPHHPQSTVLLGDYCESPEEQQRQQQRIDEMLATWSEKLAVDGPDYVDKDLAQQSFRVWFVVRNMTIHLRDTAPLSEGRRKKLLPAIKKIAQRMQSQMPPEGESRTERLNPYQVKTFRRESQQMLAWVAEQEG